MATRRIDISIGEYYHLYNRGTDSRNIFLDNEDRDRFIKLLFVANNTKPFVFRELPSGVVYKNFKREKEITAIGAYCLMSNHFHLLLKETEENGISNFISRVLTSYSSYFNKKYARTGRLFEGTFKVQHLDTDEYLKYMFSYIHLNPIKIIDPRWKESGISDKVKAERYLEDYDYSSYFEYIDVSRQESVIVNKKEFPEYFNSKKDFKDFINDWLNFSKLNT